MNRAGPRVQVLLSTMNGERYLTPLLDSVLGQDHPNLDILVRDDGSRDGTRALLERYAAGDRVRLVIGDNLGVVRSFFELLAASAPEADYVALCDQDDVWLPDKVSRALRFLDDADPARPRLYASRLQVVDEALAPVEMSPRPHRPLALGNALVENLLPGCTMVLNRAARDLVASARPAFAFMHDWWIYQVLAACGEIRYDDESRILYRQHAQNAVGIAPGLVGKWSRRFSKFMTRNESLARQVDELLRLFGDRLSPEHRAAARLVSGSERRFIDRLRLAATPRVYRQAPLDDLVFRGIVLANRL